MVDSVLLEVCMTLCHKEVDELRASRLYGRKESRVHVDIFMLSGQFLTDVRRQGFNERPSLWKLIRQDALNQICRQIVNLVVVLFRSSSAVNLHVQYLSDLQAGNR